MIRIQNDDNCGFDGFAGTYRWCDFSEGNGLFLSLEKDLKSLGPGEQKYIDAI